MKIITIPSLPEQHSEIKLKFHDKKVESASYLIELSCTTPSYTAKVYAELEETEIQRFINNLTDVEKDKKGHCS